MDGEKTESMSSRRQSDEEPADAQDASDKGGSCDTGECSASENNTAENNRPGNNYLTDEFTPKLTIVIFGETNSTEMGPRNLLLDPNDQTNMERFSSKLYDFCGRHISVINMLGRQTLPKQIQEKGVHAFILMVPHVLRDSTSSSGERLLERALGKESLAYLLTVVTYSREETYESIEEELRLDVSFKEKRYHVCASNMADKNEILDLLEKIDLMVFENDPYCFTGLTCEDNAEEDEFLQNSVSQEDENMYTSVCQSDQDGIQSSAPETEVMNDSHEKDTRYKPSKEQHDTKSEVEFMEVEEQGAAGEKSETAGEEKEAETTNDGGLDVDFKEKVETPLTRSGSLGDQSGAPVSAAAGKNLMVPPGQASHGCSSSEAVEDGDKKEQSAKLSEDIKTKELHQREITSLLSKLHLQDKYQKKLTTADFLQITRPVKQLHDLSEKEVAHTYLQTLMMLDYRARYIHVRKETLDVNQSTSVQLTLDTQEIDFDAFLSPAIDSSLTEQSHVHPMDVQMAVFHCADNFLKQKIITKLSQCQYALPLIVPDPFTRDIKCPMWTFRQITKSWKTTKAPQNSKAVSVTSAPICNTKTAMVAFFRLGSLSLSKSHLMNMLINDRHMTFFHRHSPGSTKSRHLIEGLVEIAWYCPAGKPNDGFTDCIAFCNLRGDALTFQKQRDILTDMSSVNVVLLPTLEKDSKSWTVLSDLLKSPKPLICLTTENDGGSVKLKEGKYRLGLKDKSQSDVSEQLKGIFTDILSGPYKSFQLDTMAHVPGLKVDEENAKCQRGKSAALRIVDLLKEMDVSSIKEVYLPCQATLWHQWCQINKALYNLKGHIEKERCQRQNELKNIRKEQCDVSCSNVMQLFIDSLLTLQLEEKEYFLKWCQVLLDGLSTGDLSSILEEYDEKWSEVLALKRKAPKSDHLISQKTDALEQISAKLQSATFGLEHIFREMGQIYEAHEDLQRPPGPTGWSKYPELAAELMISGHPMELMDGDAGHVPLKWIMALLEEVSKKLNNPRIFVLSVMGVQSSGKSTMLNAMFGLQFAVSSGRCTKGAFMQLVKVSEDMKRDFNVDYILVVDTEGLRALELAGNATLHHDNELATFVVGLGNMTLLNIFGENPAEMQDVLQIVVQAIMRMKKVKLSPSCVFVHQNVTDIAAAEKNMDGKRRLQEKLDQMAKLAAVEEVCDANCFSDIIAFDVQKDVKYFAQLWEGSPPMAPPNPGYSESVQELKRIILSKAKKSKGMTLLAFKTKVRDLWNALLNENFVFSFKNTLEIAVYRKLEARYGNWTWAIRSEMLTIENQLYTRIENGNLDAVELGYLHKQISQAYDKIKNDLTTHFDDPRDKDVLVQWRGRFENKIKEFRDEQVSAVKRKLDEVIQQKRACKKLDDKKIEFENTLLQRSKELAHQLKNKDMEEEELENQFNQVWDKWVIELTADIEPIKPINLENDTVCILLDHGIEMIHIDESKRSGNYKNISRIGDFFEYVTLNKHQEDKQQQEGGKKSNRKQQGTSFWSLPWIGFQKMLGYGKVKEREALKARKDFPFEEQNSIRSFIDNIEEMAIATIESKPVTARGYSPTYLQELAKTVGDRLAEFEFPKKYALKKEFKVDLLLYVFDIASTKLLASHKKFIMNNDAVTFVKSKKTQNYNIFKSFFKGNSSAVVLGEMICEKLKGSAIEAACNKAAIDLAGEMKCSVPAFNGNRQNLEKHVLKYLAEKENFEEFIAYISHPGTVVEAFIREEVKKYIFTKGKKKAMSIFNKNAEIINYLLNQATFTATDMVKKKRGDTEMWLKEFSRLVKDELTFDTICARNFCDINNFDFLKDEVNKGLVTINKEMSSFSMKNMEDFRLQPDQILIEQLCKVCWVQCPFCAAICTNTLEDHSPDDHSVPFHRPSGINGWHYRGTVEMSVNFCTSNVASNRSFYPDHDSKESVPFKQYRTGGPKYAEWNITPDESKLAYWKWFVCRFQAELENHYNLKFEHKGEIPAEWRTHTKEKAISSLDEMCE